MKDTEFRAWDKDNKEMLDNIIVYQGEVYKNTNPVAVKPLNADLLQYTGFKDKKDSKIFEGHILTDGKNNYLVTIYHGAWRLKSNKDGDPWYKALYRYAKDCKVIGTIFENPELIEGVRDE